MTDRIACGGLQVAPELYRFINDEAIPGTGLEADQFWAGVDQLVHELAPINRELVAKRDVPQADSLAACVSTSASGSTFTRFSISVSQD